MVGIGQGAGLLISQILKYEAPGAVIQVQPTNAWEKSSRQTLHAFAEQSSKQNAIYLVSDLN